MGRGSREYRHGLGFLPQNPSWHGWMRARDAVLVFAWMRAVARRGRAEAVDAVLQAVELEAVADRRIKELSGGQFQRLMLATALVHDPSVLLLNEPSVGLDPEQRLGLRRLLRTAARDRVVLVSTHLLDDVSTTADRVVVIDRGRIRFDGMPGELADRSSKDEGDSATDIERGYLGLFRDNTWVGPA